MTELLKAADRVALGVKYLDDEYPGWRSLIDIESFSLSSTSNCVLGQVLGSYYDHELPIGQIYRYGFDICCWPEEQAEYGIDAEPYSVDNGGREQYDDLQAEWLKVFAQ